MHSPGVSDGTWELMFKTEMKTNLGSRKLRFCIFLDGCIVYVPTFNSISVIAGAQRASRNEAGTQRASHNEAPSRFR